MVNNLADIVKYYQKAIDVIDKQLALGTEKKEFDRLNNIKLEIKKRLEIIECARF